MSYTCSRRRCGGCTACTGSTDSRLPKTGEEFELADYAQAAKTLDALGNVAAIMEAGGRDQFVSVLQWLPQQGKCQKVLDALRSWTSPT